MNNFFSLALCLSNHFLRILHDHGFTEEEKALQKCIVYNNVIESMVTILAGMKTLQIRFEDTSLEVIVFFG